MTGHENKIATNAAGQRSFRHRPAPFDTAAADYDALFSHTALGMRKRTIVRRYVGRVLNQDDAVLELNCGTGEDALWMARRARRVVATDGSANMIGIVDEKRAATDQANVDTRQLDLTAIEPGSVAALRQDLHGPFDIVISNFDGINCLEDLHPLFAGVSSLVRPNGDLIVVFMSSFCLAQKAISLLKPEYGRHVTRGRNQTRMVSIGPTTSVRTTFHTVRRVTIGLKSHGFRIESVRGIGLTTPPTTVTRFYERHRRLFRLLNPLEDLLSALPPFSRMCDHVLVHAKRVDSV